MNEEKLIFFQLCTGIPSCTEEMERIFRNDSRRRPRRLRSCSVSSFVPHVPSGKLTSSLPVLDDKLLETLESTRQRPILEISRPENSGLNAATSNGEGTGSREILFDFLPFSCLANRDAQKSKCALTVSLQCSASIPLKVPLCSPHCTYCYSFFSRSCPYCLFGARFALLELFLRPDSFRSRRSNSNTWLHSSAHFPIYFLPKRGISVLGLDFQPRGCGKG